MNTRCMIPARIVAFLVMIAALFLASATTQAQVVDCSVCDHFTVRVSPNLGCSVTICYAISPGGIEVCRIVAPGQSIQIPCAIIRAWVITCSGSHVLVPASSTAPCSQDLKFGVGCCGRICAAPSLDNCTTLEIQPRPCSSTGCP